MRTSIAALLIGPLLHLGMGTALAEDEVRYVRERMTVQLRASPDQNSDVVNEGLASGSAVTLLQTDDKAGFARVRGPDGQEGWIASRYLSSEPGATALLSQARKEILELRKANEALKNQQLALPADQRQAIQQLAELQAANTRLQNKVEELERAPTSPTQLEALRQRNEELHQQFEKLSADIKADKNGHDTAMFRNGAIAVVAGMLLAVIIPRLRPRKKSEWA